MKKRKYKIAVGKTLPKFAHLLRLYLDSGGCGGGAGSSSHRRALRLLLHRQCSGARPAGQRLTLKLKKFESGMTSGGGFRLERPEGEVAGLLPAEEAGELLTAPPSSSPHEILS